MKHFNIKYNGDPKWYSHVIYEIDEMYNLKNYDQITHLDLDHFSENNQDGYITNKNTMKFDKLPKLPSSLIELYFCYNNISLLPDLPSTLKELWCCNNKLSSLGDSLPALTELWCTYNKLSSLPVFCHPL